MHVNCYIELSWSQVDDNHLICPTKTSNKHGTFLNFLRFFNSFLRLTFCAGYLQAYSDQLDLTQVCTRKFLVQISNVGFSSLINDNLFSWNQDGGILNLKLTLILRNSAPVYRKSFIFELEFTSNIIYSNMLVLNFVFGSNTNQSQT